MYKLISNFVQSEAPPFTDHLLKKDFHLLLLIFQEFPLCEMCHMFQFALKNTMKPFVGVSLLESAICIINHTLKQWNSVARINKLKLGNMKETKIAAKQTPPFISQYDEFGTAGRNVMGFWQIIIHFTATNKKHDSPV